MGDCSFELGSETSTANCLFQVVGYLPKIPCTFYVSLYNKGDIVVGECGGIKLDLEIDQSIGGGIIEVCVFGDDIISAEITSYVMSRKYDVLDPCPPANIQYDDSTEVTVAMVTAYDGNAIEVLRIIAAPPLRYLLAPYDHEYISILGATSFSSPAYLVDVYSNENSGAGIIAIGNGGCSVYIDENTGTCDDLIYFTNYVNLHPSKPAKMIIHSNGAGKLPDVKYIY